MAKTKMVERPKDRVLLAEDAGLGRVSFPSLLAGVLVAYGAFAVLAAVIGSVASAIGVDTTLDTNEWRNAGIVGGVVLSLVLLVSWFYGGYVAGRMARRSGMLHGGLVFLLGLVLALVAGALVGMSQGDALADNLRSIGVPTTSDDLRMVASATGIAALLAMLIGSLLGGRMGDRWHNKLLTRALDPSIGAEAAERERLAKRNDDVDRRHDDTDRRVATATGGRDIDLRDHGHDGADGHEGREHDRSETAEADREHAKVGDGGSDRNREAERWNPNSTNPPA